MANILWNLSLKTKKVLRTTGAVLKTCRKCGGLSHHHLCCRSVANLEHPLQKRQIQLDSSTKPNHSTCCLCFLPPKYANNNQLNEKCYSTSTKLAVTLDTIYSEENKSRVQGNLLSVKPARTFLKMKENYRTAAVLLPLCHVNGEPSILFMVRSKDIPNHRGEICFPGGMSDDGDSSLVQTALRETNEEIGLDVSEVDVWGSGQPSPSRQDGSVLVTPVISYCGHVDVTKLSLNSSEVETVFTRTVASLCSPSNNGSTQFRTGYTLPLFTGGEHRIWGLTAIILHQSLTLIAPGLYTYKLRHNS